MSWKEEEDNQIIDEINMTPLIDVMLVLLIIFMVTSSVSVESGLNIALPNYSGETADIKTPIKISLQNNGRLFLQDEPISLNGLEEELKILMQNNLEREIILQGDKGSRLTDIVELMDVATKVGAKNFSIAVSKEAQSD